MRNWKITNYNNTVSYNYSSKLIKFFNIKGITFKCVFCRHIQIVTICNKKCVLYQVIGIFLHFVYVTMKDNNPCIWKCPFDSTHVLISIIFMAWLKSDTYVKNSTSLKYFSLHTNKFGGFKPYFNQQKLWILHIINKHML